MPRNYKPKNRYCKNTKLNEQEFTLAIRGFVDGLSAAAVAREINRSDRSIRDLFTRFRRRLMDDEALTGWMGGGALPEEDATIWTKLYDCLMKCPAYVDDRVLTSPLLVRKYRGYHPDGDYTQRSLSVTLKKRGAECKTCPIQLKFEFDISARGNLAQQDLRVGGIPRDNFKQHYFEAMLRANIETENSKFGPECAEKFTVEHILARLSEQPL